MLQLWKLIGFRRTMAEGLENLKEPRHFGRFLVCTNRNSTALLRELLSNKSQFVG